MPGHGSSESRSASLLMIVVAPAASAGSRSMSSPGSRSGAALRLVGRKFRVLLRVGEPRRRAPLDALRGTGLSPPHVVIWATSLRATINNPLKGRCRVLRFID